MTPAVRILADLQRRALHKAPPGDATGKPCETCIHAVAASGTGPLCGRTAGRYLCEDERALGWFAALAYDACGARGRFHADAGTPRPGSNRTKLAL